MMNNEKLAMYSNDLLNSIIKIIEKHGEIVNGRLEYWGRAILVEDNYGTRMWIRVVEWKDEKIRVDFSTVEFRDKLRRKGIFREICNMVRKKDYIESAVISNVCTQEMYNFCHKHNLAFNEMMNTYRVK